MGLLDKFRKVKEIEKAQGEQAEEQYDFKPGDKMTEGPFQLTFINREITRNCGPYGDYITVIGHEIGWAIECMDKTTPMKDVVMPDVVEGYPVVEAKGCFKGCYNVASVSHISAECIKNGNVSEMFSNSGLREMPEQLTGNNVVFACLKAYALQGVEQLSSEHGYYMEPNIAEKKRAEETIIDFERSKEKDTLLIEDGFSQYEKFEKISFVYDFHPVSIIRAQDLDGKWFAVDPNGPSARRGSGFYHTDTSKESALVPYDAYMKQFKSDKIQGLTVDSFVEISSLEGKKAIENAYDVAIQGQKLVAEKAQAKFDKAVAEAIEKADKAQEGLDFIPRKVEPQTQETNNDTKAITENEDRDEI